MKKLKFRKNILEFVDYDYLDQLSPEELEWFTQFNNEYYSNASYDKNGSIHKKVLGEKFTKKDPEYSNSLGKPNSIKQDLKRDDYMRSQDIYGNSKAHNLLANIDDIDLSETRDQKDSIPYLLKIKETEQIMNDLIEETLESLRNTDDSVTGSEILKDFLKKSMRLITLSKKLIKKENKQKTNRKKKIGDNNDN